MRVSVFLAASLAASIVIGMVPWARATVTDVGLWRLGEDDPGAVAGGPGQAPSVAAINSPALDLTIPVGTPTYSADTPNALSSLSMDFDPGDYYRGPVPTSVTDNFGIEAWVNRDSLDGNQGIAWNGNLGWGLLTRGDDIQGHMNGVGNVGTGGDPVAVGTWFEVALVRDSGTATLYLNGTPNGATVTGNPPAPAGSLWIGQIGGAPGSFNSDGKIDQVRVFTFDAGQFDPATDLTWLGPPGPPTWNTTGGGFWDDAANWTSSAPGGNDTLVFFGDKIIADATVATDLPVTVKGIEFDNANGYAIAGRGSVNMEADVDNATINVVQGNHEFQAVVNLVSDTDVTVAAGASLTFNNALNLGGKTLTQTGDGTMTINNKVSIGGGTIVAAAGALAGTGTVGGNLIVGNTFVYPINDEGGDPIVVAGRLGLAPWTLTVNGDGRTQAIGAQDKFAVFEFDTVGAGSVPAGREDLNADGQVGDADLNLLLSSFGTTDEATLAQMDLTGDGNVDQADLDVLFAAFGAGTPAGTLPGDFNVTIQPGTGTDGWNIDGASLVQEGNQLLLTGITYAGALSAQPVPEPASLLLLALGLLAIVPIARRRK